MVVPLACFSKDSTRSCLLPEPDDDRRLATREALDDDPYVVTVVGLPFWEADFARDFLLDLDLDAVPLDAFARCVSIDIMGILLRFKRQLPPLTEARKT
jgi:hypothetical protein